MFEELISAGIVSIIVLMLLITLPGEAPLKRLLSKHAISKLFYYYATFYLTFAMVLLFWTAMNWVWKSVSFQSYTIIAKLEKRITKLLLLIILVIPCRYILRLMTIPPSMNKHNKSTNNINKLQTITEISHKRHKSVPLITFEKQMQKNKESKTHKIRDTIDMTDIKNLLFGAKSESEKKSKPILRINKETPFQSLEKLSTAHNALQWQPLPLELFNIAGLWQLFAKIRVHGRANIPRTRPCLIIINHALGHGFDVPMIVYILRKYCALPRVRVLVSAQHFNYPIWCDLIYYLGGVPRTYAITQQLMERNENIIMFAAKKKKTSMIWDNKRHLYLDLVYKHDYVLVPAVCVSEGDVINMVYNIGGQNSKNTNKKTKFKFEMSNNNETDTDCESVIDENENQSLDTMTGRFRRGYRKQYHLRFSEPISVPKNQMRPRKTRKSMEFKSEMMDSDENNSFLSENSSPQSGSKMEVRFSGLQYSVSSESDSKYNDIDSIDMNSSPNHSLINQKRKRRWSRELEVGLKNAVEDAMTDGISEMYTKLKSDPNSSLLKTIQKKMKKISIESDFVASLRSDIRSTTSNDIPVNGAWVE